MLAFTQLLDMERMEDARATDARYHAAKLAALAASVEPGPKVIWDEHEDFRRGVLDPVETTPDLWAAAKALHDKVRRLGLAPHTEEARH